MFQKMKQEVKNMFDKKEKLTIEKLAEGIEKIETSVTTISDNIAKIELFRNEITTTLPAIMKRMEDRILAMETKQTQEITQFTDRDKLFELQTAFIRAMNTMESVAREHKGLVGDYMNVKMDYLNLRKIVLVEKDARAEWRDRLVKEERAMKDAIAKTQKPEQKPPE